MQEEPTYQHLTRLTQGNEASFRWLYDRYHGKIYRYCLRLIRLQPLAEEATADVFVAVWKRREYIDPTLPFEPLLYKIAKDTAYNYLKKIATDKRLQDNFIQEVMRGQVDKSGEKILIEKEALLALTEIVEHLPHKRKEIFKLRFYEGLDNPSIAQQLNISVNTVREQLARARAYLRKYNL